MKILQKKLIKLELAVGNLSGLTCIYLNDCRIAGAKPLGGCKIIKTWNIDKEHILEALKRV